MKSKIIAYLLWLFGIFGCLGWHRFYLGKYKSGLLWLFTGGLAGIGSLIDLFSLGEQVKQVNNTRVLEKLAHGETVKEFERISGDKKTAKIATDSYCPYCMGILGRKPKHNLSCPFCRKAIYVRLKPHLFDNNLLTAEDALILDQLPKTARFGITGDAFKMKRTELQEKFGAEITSADVFWDLLKQVITETKEPAVLKKIYQQAGLFLKGLNHDLYYLLQRTFKMQLLEYQRDGFTKMVRVAAGSDSCPACRSLDGRTYSIDEALELMPLPCRECSHRLTKQIGGFCRCSYQAAE